MWTWSFARSLLYRSRWDWWNGDCGSGTYAPQLLVELRRRNIELPQQAVLRLETIATLAVRMRETVRRLSEDWETQSEHASEELETHPS